MECQLRSLKVKTYVERTGNVLAGAGLGEEGRETVVVVRGRALHEAAIGLERESASRARVIRHVVGIVAGSGPLRVGPAAAAASLPPSYSR